MRERAATLDVLIRQTRAFVAEHQRAGKAEEKDPVRLLVERLQQGLPFGRLALGQIT